MSSVVVGGGITGLAAAYELRKGRASFTLLERNTRLGGVILTRTRNGNTLEAGPDSFIAQKPAALELIRELGLDAELIGSNDHLRVTFMQRKGRLVPLPDGMMMMIPTRIWPMARSPLLSWDTKIRMVREYFRKPSDPGDRSVADFIRDHFGQEAVDYLAEPLLAGVYGGDPEKLSANSTLPRFVDMERKHGSLTKAALLAKTPQTGVSLFRSLKGGLGSLVEALRPPQENTRLGVEAEALERTASGYRVRAAGDWIDCAKVILAGPSYEAARLLRPFAAPIAEILEQTPYASSATVTLVYRKADLPAPLRGFGILIPGVERKRMRACTFVGNKFPHRVAGHCEVIRCFVGGAADEAILEESDEEIISGICDELRNLLGISAAPESASVDRWRKAMAQFTVGHQARMAELRKRLEAYPGLHLAGNGYQGIGIPDCIELGRAAARASL